MEVVALMRMHLSVDELNESMAILRSVALENPRLSEEELLPRKQELLSVVKKNRVVFEALRDYFDDCACLTGDKRVREPDASEERRVVSRPYECESVSLVDDMVEGGRPV